MEQKRLAALVEQIEELVGEVITPEHPIAEDRLREAVQICSKMDTAVLPIGLILAASATLERGKVRPFLSRLPNALPDAAVTALDTVSETLLMITDADVKASGSIVASIFVLHALPNGLAARDGILESLLVLTEKEHQPRAMRHSQIFALLPNARDGLKLEGLAPMLTQVSEALEDFACEHEVFLDNPVELVPKKPLVFDTAEIEFKEARVKSGADIPTLREELEKVERLQEIMGWTRDRALSFVTELYRLKVMDSRTKLGLSLVMVCDLVTDLNRLMEKPTKDLLVKQEPAADPFSYDWETESAYLHVGHRGALTTRGVKEAREAIFERLQTEKLDRETSTLEKAVDRFQAARAQAFPAASESEEETAEIKAMAKTLSLPLDQAYDAVAQLYGAERLVFSNDPTQGISLETLRKTIAAASKPGEITTIIADQELDGRIPFSVDKDSRTLKLHTSFEPLTELTIEHCLKERSIEPLPLATTDDAVLPRYADPEKPGSIANEKNLERVAEEFSFAKEFASDSFEVMLDGCPGLGEAVSIQALRVLIATINERLAPSGRTVDVVTAFSREIPGSQKEDFASIAWLAEHSEDDVNLLMLTLNFNYGEGKRKFPSFSDEELLAWCRHFIPER